MCIAVLAILYSLVGVGAVAGMTLLCLLLPLQLSLTARIGDGRRRAMRFGDTRVKWMTEVLTHIRTVKLCVDPFSKSVESMSD